MFSLVPGHLKALGGIAYQFLLLKKKKKPASNKTIIAYLSGMDG